MKLTSDGKGKKVSKKFEFLQLNLKVTRVKPPTNISFSRWNNYQKNKGWLSFNAI